MSFPALGINRKFVDIEIYLNMQNEQNPMSHFLAKSEKPVFFDKKLLIKKILDTFRWYGFNTKVVDIDKIYQNMQNEQNPMSRFLSNGQKPHYFPKGKV